MDFKAIISAILSFFLAIGSFLGLYSGEPRNTADALYDENEIVSVIVELDHAGLLEGISDASAREKLVETIETNEQYRQIQSEQASLKEKIQSRFSLADFTNSLSYSFIANGFSVDIPYKYVDALSKLPGIRSVTVSASYEEPSTVIPLDLNEGNTYNSYDEFTGVIGAHEAGYTGKGSVIAILDTGFQVDHEALTFSIEDPTYSKKDIQLKSAFGFLNTIVPRFSAHYVSEKIPYKWDYANVDKDVYNPNSSHGTHVAGIAGGKCKSFTGLAPDAQFLLMKVFKDGPNSLAKEIVILAALDDCVKLGADVVNLSLGSACGQEPDNIFTGSVVRRLQRAGINVIASAGNEGSLGEFDRVYSYDDPLNIDLFDYATTNSPASYSHYMSVASAAIYGISSTGENLISIPGTGRVQMSDFSAWGPTEDLRLKPEITTPGSRILSCVNENQYDYFYGTSMASPYYAGAAALFKQYVHEQIQTLGKKDISEWINSVLMSTATVFSGNRTDEVYSPRRQGAGFLNLDSAFKTPAYLTQTDGVSRPKIELGEADDSELDLAFQIHNMSDRALTYALNEIVLSDGSRVLNGSNVNTQKSVKLGANDYSTTYLEGISEDGVVSLGARESKTIRMRISLTESFLETKRSIFKNGFFVDGFVVLKDAANENPTLSIPYMTFFGDWYTGQLFDYSIYDEEEPFLDGDWGLAVTDGNKYYPLGFNIFEPDKRTHIDPKFCAFSKNARGMSKAYITVSIGVLRNCKRMDFNLFTQNGIFRYCGSTLFDYCRKTTSKGSATHGVLWGGKSGLINNHEYVYKVSTRGQTYKTKRTTVSFPFVVDNDAAQVIASSYHVIDGDAVLNVKIKDNHYVMGFQLFNGSDEELGSVSFSEIEPENGVYDYTLNVSELTKHRKSVDALRDLKLYVVDYAYNETYAAVQMNSPEVKQADIPANALHTMRAYFFNKESVAIDTTESLTNEAGGDAFRLLMNKYSLG